PHGVAPADLPHSFIEAAGLPDLDIGAPELAGMPALDLAAQLQRQRLLAVADGEDRHVGVQHRLRCTGTPLLGHGRRAARKDDPFWTQGTEGLVGLVERVDFTIDARLAQAAGDQLRYLRSEIDDEYGVDGRRGWL